MTTRRLSELDQAREAIAVVGPKFAELLRASAQDMPAIVSWDIGEVASHVAFVLRTDTDALAGRQLPPDELTPAGAAAMNAAALAADPVRDIDVLAARIENSIAEFLATSNAIGDRVVTWLGGVELPASAVSCHLLEELLVHGVDVAGASDATWTIDPSHAALAIVGAAVPILNAAGPTAFVHLDRARGYRARISVRVRGGEQFTFVFDDGLTVEAGCVGPVDGHLAADPVPLLLVMLGRLSAIRSLDENAIEWDGEPEQFRSMLAVMAAP